MATLPRHIKTKLLELLDAANNVAYNPTLLQWDNTQSLVNTEKLFKLRSTIKEMVKTLKETNKKDN